MAADFENLWADGATALLDLHGETVTQWPAGVAANAVSIPQAIVELDLEENAPIDDGHGSQRKRRARLTVPASVNVQVVSRKQTRDEFLIRGLLWIAQDIESEDTQLQVVRIVRTESATTRKTRTQ